jgi:hypothetical protein
MSSLSNNNNNAEDVAVDFGLTNCFDIGCGKPITFTFTELCSKVERVNTSGRTD